MTKSTKSRRSGKFLKPYPDFPLTAHPSGRWCKKRRGKQYYFGRIDSDGDYETAWKTAYERYKREWPYILDGREPPPDGADGLTVAALCNAFLNAKLLKMKAGELSARSWDDYHTITSRLVDHFGRHRNVDDLRPDDFQKLRASWAERLGVVSLKNQINRARVVFKFASDQRLIERPVHYGQSFERPSAKSIRKARNEAGPRLFSADEVRRILDEADPIIRAMTLLGINCGFGNTDVANLQQAHLDLDGGWVEFPRPKTEIQRRIPLWPETVAVLRETIANRPTPKNKADADCVFLTSRSNRWVRIAPKRHDARGFLKFDTVATRFRLLLRRLKINSRPGIGFYTLRHCFQTVGGDAKDPESVAAIMGHVDSSMGAVYRERIPDERLLAVVNVVHDWLWPSEGTTGRGK